MILSELSAIRDAGLRAWTDAPPAVLTRSGGDADGLSSLRGRGNALIRGDNLGVMKACARNGMAGAFDLIYADPPFFSRRDYAAHLPSEAGANAPATRRMAYSDRWRGGFPEYLAMLVPRLYGFRELLSETGSLWVHLDWHAAHYVKVLLDVIFGEANFVNEVIWQYKSGGANRRHFARKHDTLLFYAKSAAYFFNPQREKSYNRELRPYRFKGVEEYRDETGWYTLVNMKDVWQIDMVGRTATERTGYATQKPEALLGRIVESCTRPGDLCADFFGGSGTLGAVCEKNERRWLLCDAGARAADGARARMTGLGADFGMFEVKE